MRRRAWHLWTSTIAAAAVGCAGTSTGNPWEDPGENATSGMCEEVKTALPSLDAASPLGFSAGEMLALAHGSEEVSLEWVPNSAVTFGPEQGAGALSVSVQPHDGGKPRYVDRTPKAQRGGAEPAIGSAATGGLCPDGVELDVIVEIASRGGALDERFESVLRATSASVARIYQQRKAPELGGSLEVALKTDSSAKLETAIFDLKFSELGPSGSLDLTFKPPAPSGSGENSSVSSGVNAPGIARWPANVQCEDDPLSGAQFGARTDQKIDQFSAQDGVDRFNAASLQLSAPGAAATKLTASFVPEAGACAVLEGAQFGPDEPVPNVVVAGTLRLRSENGRIDGEWPMQLKAAAGADQGLGSVKVAYDLHGSMIASLVEAAKFESTYGIHGLDMSGFDEAGIVVSITVDAGAAVSGELVVNGVKHANCPAQPAPSGGAGSSAQGTAGCAGAQFTPVWTATISGAF